MVAASGVAILLVGNALAFIGAGWRPVAHAIGGQRVASCGNMVVLLLVVLLQLLVLDGGHLLLFVRRGLHMLLHVLLLMSGTLHILMLMLLGVSV
jgi:hypothetical protein